MVTHTPPMTPSDEATQEQLQMARDQGEVLGKALHHMTQKEAHGEERQAGDYLVGYAVEQAEGMYMLQGGELVWYDPREENAHIEISVRDAADKRFIPGLTVRLTVLDQNEQEVGTHIQPFLWHPWLYHYGRNWIIPEDGEYTFHVYIEAPDFPRHDKKNGLRYAESVEIEFKGVQINTGRKISS
ncbi:MAG: iron transporter [Anaerolineae bacterium]|nr:iron transporter [Anaerolineae bacterium]